MKIIGKKGLAKKFSFVSSICNCGNDCNCAGNPNHCGCQG